MRKLLSKNTALSSFAGGGVGVEGVAWLACRGAAEGLLCFRGEGVGAKTPARSPAPTPAPYFKFAFTFDFDFAFAFKGRGIGAGPAAMLLRKRGGCRAEEGAGVSTSLGALRHSIELPSARKLVGISVRRQYGKSMRCRVSVDAISTSPCAKLLTSFLKLKLRVFGSYLVLNRGSIRSCSGVLS